MPLVVPIKPFVKYFVKESVVVSNTTFLHIFAAKSGKICILSGVFVMKFKLLVRGAVFS